MSTQTDVNMNPTQFILYYCNNINADAAIYNIDLSNVCTFGYDAFGNLQVFTWLLGNYGAPTNVQLTSYVLATVLTWYNYFYTLPLLIEDSQAFLISSIDLALVRADASMVGWLVYDTTNHNRKIWTGTVWDIPTALYLSTSGGVVTGNISQTNPSCLSIGSSDNVSTSFTANTPQLIPITGFTQSLNANSDFLFNSSNGECKYTGSVTRPFRVTIQYSYVALTLATTLTNFISKNSSVTIPISRSVVSFILGGQSNIFKSSISSNIILSTNDTIILGGNLDTSNSVSFQAVSYDIEQI